MSSHVFTSIRNFTIISLYIKKEYCDKRYHTLIFLLNIWLKWATTASSLVINHWKRFAFWVEALLEVKSIFFKLLYECLEFNFQIMSHVNTYWLAQWGKKCWQFQFKLNALIHHWNATNHNHDYSVLWCKFILIMITQLKKIIFIKAYWKSNVYIYIYIFLFSDQNHWKLIAKRQPLQSTGN